MANNPEESIAGRLANLKRLAYFAAVVETGSFTAAADRLGITKAVVSQQVARLEREFRTTLLTRTTRKVVPTDAGRLFYQRCASILKEAGDAFDELGGGGRAFGHPAPDRCAGLWHHGGGACHHRVHPALPQCKVDAVFSDQSLDLMSGQVEPGDPRGLAFRPQRAGPSDRELPATAGRRALDAPASGAAQAAAAYRRAAFRGEHGLA